MHSPTFNANTVNVGLFNGVLLTQETLPLTSSQLYRLSGDAIASDGDGGLGVVFTGADRNAYYAERIGLDD